MILPGILSQQAAAPPACQSCLGELTTEFAVAGNQALLLSGAPCNRTVATPEPLQAAAYVATTASAKSITIDWPASEVRIVAMDIIDWLQRVGGYKDSLALMIASFDGGVADFVVATAVENESATSWVIGASQNDMSAGNLSLQQKPTQFTLAVRGDGAVYVIAAGLAVKLPDVNTLDVSKSWMVGAVTDNTAEIFTGVGRSTIITDKSGFDAPLPMLPDVFTVSTFCGEAIFSRAPDDAGVWPFSIYGSSETSLIISGTDSQTVEMPAEPVPDQPYYGLLTHDSVQIDWPASEVRGCQVKTVQWDGRTGNERSLIFFLGADSVIGLRFDAAYDGADTTLFCAAGAGQIEQMRVTGQRISDAFVGVSGDKKVWLIANGVAVKAQVWGGGADGIYPFDKLNFGYAAYNSFVGQEQVTPPKLQLITKSAEMDIAVPDMTGQGISKVCDFAGNQIP